MPDENPLDYETPRPPAKSGGSSIGCLAGLGLGIFAALIGGVAAAPLQYAPSAAPHARPVSILFFAVGVIALVGGISFLGLGRRQRRLFWAGFLLGIAVMSLLEGTCFAAG